MRWGETLVAMWLVYSVPFEFSIKLDLKRWDHLKVRSGYSVPLWKLYVEVPPL